MPQRVVLNGLRKVVILGGVVSAAMIAWLAWPPSPQTGDLQSSASTARSSPDEADDDARAPTNTATTPPPAAGQPRAGRDPEFRYFGYCTMGPSSVMAAIAPYTNAVMIRNWADRGESAIAAAKEAGLPMVLCVHGKERDKILKHLPDIMAAYGDQVVAMCWLQPYQTGYKPGDVSSSAASSRRSTRTFSTGLAMRSMRAASSTPWRRRL